MLEANTRLTLTWPALNKTSMDSVCTCASVHNVMLPSAAFSHAEAAAACTSTKDADATLQLCSFDVETAFRWYCPHLSGQV